ncbi:unnamed protein product [Brachionus calyciflorus]|uniref:Uncharacterized protein n=1 Tax=Brachionus calyciflorus TaxID=104777 RepID=A0A813ZWX9_9BILA|nr:unnamed protein product [Brachionus calyciflorus]
MVNQNQSLIILLLLAFFFNLIQSELLYINDEYIKKNYLSDLSLNDRKSITFGQTPDLTLSNLQLTLQNDNYRYSKSIEISGFKSLVLLNSTKEPSLNLIELFFPLGNYTHKNQIENLINSNRLDLNRFDLRHLNLSSNNFDESFLNGYSLKNIHNSHSTLFDLVLRKYFSKIYVLNLSFNRIQILQREHFELFSSGDSNKIPTNLEVIFLNNNELSSIKHDTFYDLKNLKFLDLSSNRLKIIHPLLISYSNLNYLNLRFNNLKGVFNGLNGTLQNLTHFYLDGNKDLKCDCGLEWLWQRKNEINIDFNCGENFCLNEEPNLFVNNENLDESSEISIIRKASKTWFGWTVFTDDLPPLIPYPYLISNQTKPEKELITQLENQEKHVYHSWLFSDVILKCSNRNESDYDNTESIILWKTQYGYFSNLNEFDIDLASINKTSLNSYKIFYKFNKLTKIYKNKTIRISEKLGALSKSVIYVNEENNLVITNMRNLVSGPFVCLSINENDVKSYEYNILVRTGVSEYFIYSLFVSLISMIIPSIIGLIICCICEYQVDKNYPMTPPCYPTPMASTPPNFDFNEWMANAASYFPNLNIQETLEQVSKRLRKGMEKASVTVKSLGMTSTAYIYSMYEQSSQRWYDLKQYVPNINVPSINLSLNLPNMRYPPMGQLANRMRIGMGNMFWQFREFCGSNDLTHTPSIVDIQADCSASNAVGKTYIMDQFNLHDNNRLNQENFYRFLDMIKEENKMDRENQENNLNECRDESKPCTSGLNNGRIYPSMSEIHNTDESCDEELPVTKRQEKKEDDLLVNSQQSRAESN